MKNLLPCEESMMHKLLIELSTTELLCVMHGQLGARNEEELCKKILDLITKEAIKNAD